MEQEKNCGTCKHRLEEGQVNYCRRYPPIPQYVPVETAGFRQPQLVLQGVMPPVRTANYCGEYQPRVELTN
jgi:hypothetical protein